MKIYKLLLLLFLSITTLFSDEIYSTFRFSIDKVKNTKISVDCSYSIEEKYGLFDYKAYIKDDADINNVLNIWKILTR